MNVRSQVSMVFHLDKCIGCHTCSLACKNIWTDRQGTEYMCWNNVETKPGTGYPIAWEDQEKYRGGWEVANGELNLKSTSKFRLPTEIFHHPYQPTMDDYYEPWTYDYQNLFNAPEGPDQPTAKPISMVTGEYIDINAGPNWDDDLGGSQIYGKNDPNFQGISPELKAQLFAFERIVFFYLPRICNHCLNPACVASCPSGALYKRGEDGIVLVDQKSCRAWRSCISACPYKKVYFNWSTGKSEKCILCFPRVETGQAPACFHSCVGRIRYLGVLLYDAEKIEEIARRKPEDLVEAHRSLILDPFDPNVIEGAKRGGIQDDVIKSAQESPLYKFVKLWKIALPPHIEFRTLPMLFYVPPLSPVLATRSNDVLDHASGDFFHDIENSRVPVRFLTNLLGAGNEGVVRYALRKQKAVRWYRRAITVGDVPIEAAKKMLQEADCSPEEADAIYRMTALATFEDRFAIPSFHREMGIEAFEDTQKFKERMGFGFIAKPERGW